MSRSIRLALVGLLSALLTLGMAELTTVSASAAPASASVTGRETAACTTARQQDAAAAADVSAQAAKYKKTQKKLKKAKKVYKKAKTVKNKKKLKQAKKKNRKARSALITASNNRGPSSSAVVVFCGTNPSGTPSGTPLPSSTPGTSPLQPLCATLPQLQPLCDATEELGNTSPLQPLCDAIPQLAPLCAVKPGDLADPANITRLLDLIKANVPQGASLLTFVSTIVTRLLNGDLQGVAQTLGTTPTVLAQLLRDLGVPVPALV